MLFYLAYKSFVKDAETIPDQINKFNQANFSEKETEFEKLLVLIESQEVLTYNTFNSLKSLNDDIQRHKVSYLWHSKENLKSYRDRLNDYIQQFDNKCRVEFDFDEFVKGLQPTSNTNESSNLIEPLKNISHITLVFKKNTTDAQKQEIIKAALLKHHQDILSDWVFHKIYSLRGDTKVRNTRIINFSIAVILFALLTLEYVLEATLKNKNEGWDAWYASIPTLPITFYFFLKGLMAYSVAKQNLYWEKEKEIKSESISQLLSAQGKFKENTQDNLSNGKQEIKNEVTPEKEKVDTIEMVKK